MPRTSLQQVFVLSLHRSATQSVHRLLSDAGLTGIHWPTRVEGVDYEAKCAGHETDATFIVDCLSPVLTTHDFVCDVPIPAVFEALYWRFPRAMFFAVYRNPFHWVESVRRHVSSRALDTFERALYWRYLTGAPNRLTELSDDDLIGVHLSHHAALARFFLGNPRFKLFNLESASLGEEICNFLRLQPRAIPRVDYLPRQ